MSIIQTKQLVKYRFVYKTNEKSCTYDIALLDSSLQFICFQIIVKSDALTSSCKKMIQRALNCYDLSNTAVVVTEDVKKDDPLYMFLDIMSLASNMTIRTTTLDMIPRRIATYHQYFNKKAASITRFMMDKLWKKLLELEKCPWITDEVQLQMSNMSKAAAKKQQILRMGLYYIIVKQHLVENSKKYKKQTDRV